MSTSSFSAGAGKAPIILPENIFPTPDRFSGIYDEINIRVLILESQNRFALVSLDWVTLRDEEVPIIKDAIAAVSMVEPENIWLCTTHSKNTPHFPPMPRRKSDFREQALYDKLLIAITDAASEASAQAVASFRPALLGTGFCRCLINTNKNVKTPEGWWLGSNDSGNSDSDVIIWKIEDLRGEVISLFYICNCQPVVMSGSRLEDGSRLVSGDIAGVASTFIEEEYGNDCVALWLTGASGDEWPILRSKYSLRKKGGVLEERDLGYKGFMLMEMIGTHIGEQVLMASEQINCSAAGTLNISSQEFSHLGMYYVPQQDMCPHLEYTFRLNEPCSTTINYLQIGENVLIAMSPEICSNTGKNIKLMSPIKNTAVVAFCNGSEKCLAEADHYRDITFQALNCQFAVGGAEKLFNEIIEKLNSIKKNANI